MKREVKVGIFAVLVLVAGWAVARFLQGSEIFSTAHKYYAHYEQVGGIQTASHVVINGVQVGTVTAVNLSANPADGVDVELSVDKHYAIPVDSKARIFNNGLMGGKAVEIIYGSAAEYIPNEGNIATLEAVDLMAVAGEELTDLKSQITSVTEGLVKTLDNLNTLLEQNTEGITHIVANVDGVTGNINQILTKEKEHLETALASLSEFTQTLGDNAEQVDAIVDNMAAFSQELADAELIASLEATVEQLNGVLAAVQNKEGSVGSLLYDKTLYDNLAASSENLATLLADLQQHPTRYVHFSLFGSDDEKAAKKEAKAAKKAERKAEKEEKRADKAAEKANKKADKE
jgi:phospholipid/cholesterol/gamma-HCH transport system substrate-binding protein